MARHSGQVTWFDMSKGYGFLTCGHSANVFVDAEDIEPQSRFLLKTGDSVRFDIVDSNAGARARSVIRRELPTLFTALDYDRLADEPLEGEAQPRGELKEPELQTIFLIEGDDDLRVARSEFLNAAGYLVATCNDVQLAAEVYRSGLPIDMVMMCLYPPKALKTYIHELDFLSPQLHVLLSAPVVPLDLWHEMRNRPWHFISVASSLPLLLNTVRLIFPQSSGREAA